MHGTTLVFRLRKNFCHGVAHAEAFVPDHKLYTVKSAFFRPYKEAFPAFGILFHALRRTDDLAATVLVNAYGYKDTDIFKLSAPIALEVNTVHIDIWVLSGQLAVSPFLNMHIGFLIQIADRGRLTRGSPIEPPKYPLLDVQIRLPDTSRSALPRPSFPGADNAR